MHRRVIYAMRQLKLDPGTGFKKCARVAGGVIGKYHPHGGQSVYDVPKFVSSLIFPKRRAFAKYLSSAVMSVAPYSNPTA